MKLGVLAADGFQDSEYFLPKIEIEKVGVETEVISVTREPIENGFLLTWNLGRPARAQAPTS